MKYSIDSFVELLSVLAEMKRCLNYFSNEEKMVAELWVAGVSHKEIAKRLNITEGKVEKIRI